MAFLVVFRRYAPFNQFGFGFEGDHRSGPSTSLSDTARTIGWVAFDHGTVGSPVSKSSGTEFTGGGDWLRKLLGRHYSTVKCRISNQVTGKSSVAFTAATAGANPMVPVIAPDIDTYLDFRADWVGTNLRFQGTVRGDSFPNAEVFVLDARSTGCLLFDGRTSGGRNSGPVTRLSGSHENHRLGTFNCTVGTTPEGYLSAPKSCCSVTTMN
jgi:hypothetical protein